MSSQARKSAFETPADLEESVEQIIAECDGDVRAAVRTLLVANTHALAEIAAIEAEMTKLLTDVSRGYSKGNWEWLLERAEAPIPYSRG
jgi:replication-associated recombination protein RarA